MDCNPTGRPIEPVQCVELTAFSYAETMGLHSLLMPPVELLSVTPFYPCCQWGFISVFAAALHIAIRLIEKITGADVNEQW
jgi:hypothetical protein